MEQMTETEWRRFIEECRSPAIAAVTREDGRPHATPIWIAPNGDEIVFTTYHSSGKAKALAHDPRMTLVVQDDQPPYRYVVLEGQVAGLSDDLEVLRSWAGELGARYTGEHRREEFAERNGVPGEMLGRMRIERVHATKDITD